MASMTVDIDEGVVRASGELDIRGAPAMQDALQRARELGGEEVVVDLSGVTFMDSTGLRELLRVATDGTTVVLRSVPHQVRLLLDLAGVESLFRIED